MDKDEWSASRPGRFSRVQMKKKADRIPLLAWDAVEIPNPFFLSFVL
jgi:hypothetical protein